MSAVREQSKTRRMPYAVRLLEEADIAQAAEIERDAFPTLFPPTSFRRELKNRMARYLVAWRLEDAAAPDTIEESPRVYPGDGPSYWPASGRPGVESTPEDERPLISRLLQGARGMWSRRYSAWEPGQQLIVGFLGVWYIVDEAHIVAVGVRSPYRGQGIGELLLISGIEQAMRSGAKALTLEVRVSNHIARRLYVKYGFRERGVRKGYYTDNREDALIMTTELIDTPAFRQRFRTLVEAHERRWGQSERVVS